MKHNRVIFPVFLVACLAILTTFMEAESAVPHEEGVKFAKIGSNVTEDRSALMKLAGEPLPGADIYIEQEPDDEPVKSDPGKSKLPNPGKRKNTNGPINKDPGNKGGFAIGGFSPA
jgi:hypothetical protein